MPPHVADELLDLYRRVPAIHHKYRTPAGVEFLSRLEDHVTDYGPTACARALRLSPDGLAYIRGKRIRRFSMPSEEQVAPLRAALARVEVVRRRDRPEYETAHVLLRGLLNEYTLEMVALALRMHTKRLRPFTKPPTISPIGRRKLAAARAVLAAAQPHVQYQKAVRAGEDPRLWPEFIEALRDAAPYVTAARMAEYFEMTIDQIRELLGEQAG